MSAPRLRLAWCSPWPPQRSGVAGRSAEMVPLLAARGHAIDVFVDAAAVPVEAGAAADPPQAGGVRVLSAHDLPWRRRRNHYDIAVYQIGNSRAHGFIWPYLLQWPGLVILHDARLHHARAVSLLTAGRDDAYRAEFAWSHPDVAIDAAELAVQGYDGTYYYQWPMRRAVLESARLVAVHSRGVVDMLRAEAPEARIEYLPLGEGRDLPLAAGTREAVRASQGLAAGDVVFGVFGALTADKRVSQILRAFALTHARHPQARLLLAGIADPALRLDASLDALGIRAVTRHAPAPDDEAFDALIAACDVCVNLRWPTALETSGPWVRALAAARATIVTDLEHQAHLPLLDPRTWTPHAPAPVGASADDAIGVSIDLADEDHSLRVAMHCLATDEALRARLGAAARAHWEREHRVESMVDGLEDLLEAAMRQPPPPADRLAAVRPDPWHAVRTSLAPFGSTTHRRMADLME